MKLHLDVTVRNAEELEELEQRIAELETQLERKNQEVWQMSKYAALSLRLTDQLKEARARMRKSGLDASFIDLR